MDQPGSPEYVAREYALLDRLRVQRPSAVLDVGCGDGWIPSAHASPQTAPSGPYRFVATRAKCDLLADAA